MTNEEIKEGNKLIAEFMGMTEDEYPSGLPNGTNVWGNFMDNDIKYHSSWDWLMPVVHKILREWIPETGGWPFEYTQLQQTGLGNSIDHIYIRVIEFIEWYNKQKSHE